MKDLPYDTNQSSAFKKQRASFDAKQYTQINFSKTKTLYRKNLLSQGGGETVQQLTKLSHSKQKSREDLTRFSMFNVHLDDQPAEQLVKVVQQWTGPYKDDNNRALRQQNN